MGAFLYDSGMNKKNSIRRICNSWYHHKWFRIILLLVGVDMLILGFSFALGYNALVFFVGITGVTVRAIIGIAYILVAGYIIKHAVSYRRSTKKAYLLCQHCTEELKAPEVHSEE